MDTTEKIPENGAIISKEDESEPPAKCGLGGWRPQPLQRFANIRMLTLVLTLSGMFRSMKDYYITSVLTTVERQFGFPSSLTGIIKNTDNIGFMAAVMIVNHVFRNSNKPRIFTISILLTSLGIFMMAIPHFYYGVPEMDLPSNSSLLPGHLSNASQSASSLCRLSPHGALGPLSTPDDKNCGKKDSFGKFNLGAFVILIVAQLIIGMATTPMSALSLTFIDDNVSKKNSPAYLGKA